MSTQLRLTSFAQAIGVDIKTIYAALAQVNNVDNTRDIDKPTSTATQNQINTLLSGYGVASPTGTPVTAIKVYDVPIAATYTNFGNIVVSAADLLAGPVRLIQNPDNSWTKMAMTLSTANLVSKTTDLTTVTVPASKNLFDVTKNTSPGTIMNSGLGTTAANAGFNTYDYIDIRSYPLNTVFLLRSRTTGKGARRGAVYNTSKVFISGTSPEPERLSYTKTSTGHAYVRWSIAVGSEADWQMEVSAAATDAPTPWVPYSDAYSYLKGVAGYTLPQFTPNNLSILLPSIAVNQALPAPITGKIMVLTPGSYLLPDGVTPLVLTAKYLMGWDTVSWKSIAQLAADVVIVNDVIPHSKQLFDKSAIPAANRGKLIDLGLGSLATSSTCDTSDYIDISMVPVGTAILMKSAVTGRGAERMAFYNSSKVFINGTSPSGPIASKIRDTSGAVYMRISIRFAGIEDFMVMADEGAGILPYVLFSLQRTVVKTINGAEIPTNTAAVVAPVVAPQRDIITWNILNTGDVVLDSKIDPATGLVIAAADGSSVTGKMLVKSNMSYSIWAQTAVSRTISWFDVNGAIMSFSTFATKKATFTAPTNAVTCQIDYSVAGADPIRVLFNQGKDANAWVPWADTLRTDNKAYGKTWGKICWVFGASISLTRTDLYEANWPNYAKNLGLAELQNFSTSGAGFRSGTPNPGPVQLAQAISEGHNTPDLVIFDLCTNDGLDNLGDYQTAINKLENVDALTDLDTLDLSLTYEAMLFCLFKVRFLYPNAKIVVLNCYQKVKPAATATWRGQPLADAIIKGAQYANAVVIDQFRESGILAAFENTDANGRYLRDGQHPNSDGMKLMADLITKKVLHSYL